MKEYLVTAEEMKRYDANTMREFHMPGLVLMERAALCTVEELQRVCGKKPCRVLVAAGSGNNGGDGLAVGRLLMLKGYEVTFVMPGEGGYERCTEETRRQIDILRGYGARIFSRMGEGEYDIVVDALFGVGLSRDVEGIWREAVEWIDRSGAFVCSVDIPSGLDADTGRILGCAVKASLTVTYGFRKVGQILYPGAVYCGQLVCRQMGIEERSFLQEAPAWYTYGREAGGLLPLRPADGNKGTFGKVLVIAGCAQIGGAVMMAAGSVFRAGAGMVKVVTAAQNRTPLLQFVPEAMLLTYTGEESARERAGFDAALAEAGKWADCILIGPGIGTDDMAYRLLRSVVLHSDLPLVIDADGINLLAGDDGLQKALAAQGRQGRTVIITPHPGEFARLYGCSVGDVRAHLLQYPGRLADRLSCVVVCKDARCVVVRPGGGQGYLNTTGNCGMAVAGSGDVLAGIIAGLLAQGMDGMAAAVAGVYLHGYAGDLAAKRCTQMSMTATDLMDCIPVAVMRMQGRDDKRSAAAWMQGRDDKRSAAAWTQGRDDKQSAAARMQGRDGKQSAEVERC